MKKILTTLLLLLSFSFVLTAQNTVYENTFDGYTTGDDIVTQGDYFLDIYQNPDQPRTLVIEEEDGNKYMSYDTPNVDPNSASSAMVKGSNAFAVKAGVTYNFTAKTRGPFKRGLRVINTVTNSAIAIDTDYNAENNPDLIVLWHEHSLSFTPDSDMNVIVGVLRHWNSKLDIDDLKVEDDLPTEGPAPATPYEMYKNDFSTYTEGEDQNEKDFGFDAYQETDLPRSLTITHENDEEFLRYNNDATNASANTMIRLNEEFLFKAGVDYVVSVDTRGKFKRSLKVIDVAEGTASYSSEVYNAMNDDALAADWYNLKVSFTPDADFTGRLGILREWNGLLDLDNIMIMSSEENTEEEETPEEPTDPETGYDVYFNDFQAYSENQDLEDTDFVISTFDGQQPDLERTLTVIKEGEDQALRLTIEATNQSANTLVSVSQEFTLKGGVEYILKGKTRGKFTRSLRLVDVATGEPAFNAGEYNAMNDDALAAVWHQHEGTFTPAADVTVTISVLRNWNGNLDIDDIQLRSTVDEETPGEEEETPGEEEETPGEEEETPGEEEETPGEEEGDITNIDDLESLGVKMYPSPTSSNVTIQVANANVAAATVLVQNIQGQVVQTIHPSFSGDQTTIRLSDNLQNGVYIIRLITADKNLSQRIILIR
ncbi:T9SS type A sorting domain-containing protein [Flammeovirga sp. MY04]|uniref:T9SS type A sorting domain-containing protein n=1 Tax=Flammeovirga sp. MY04 TaxID=1191459 RepID=UPI0008063410|nr:T9SS type A sorting domain-containing protein [Flammeovirga sp. MY04]ANQ51396.1 T9SS type A sorting domain-containing protein [Flammeovirga sp. MY04]